ncbi:MAG: folate-binding protein YgfZ [Burkholderiales bacterium]|nr:folate-binding protein YgfZ [Burkholderiales bacterium]
MTPAPTLSPIGSLALLTFDGPDAAAFLHGQLSTDVTGMPGGSAAWTSYNSPKGRMLATLLLWRRAPESFVGLVARDLAQALRKRLAMFVLRSKVTVGETSDVLLGVAGPGAGEALRGLADADVLALPDGRYIVRAAQERADAVRARIAAREVAAEHWDWLGVRAGVALVTLATQDRFVPQTANLDLVGGINFRKGCYPGQEIVARMQYLGRLKERMFAFHVDGAPPAPGTPIVAPGMEPANAGTVVNAAPAPGGGSDLLAVVRLDALDHALHAGAADGPLLSKLELPYAVPPPAGADRVKL